MDKSIVFFGTPEFAAHDLRQIHRDGIDIKAVVTAPDRPAGRGYELKQSDCKRLALDLGIDVLQPANLKSESFLTELKALEADLFVVVAFRMLPKQVWSMPDIGTINLHASLLPQYRGAAPINWAIINGEKKTGVSTFMIDEKIDTGEILMQEETQILDHENVGSLYDRLKKIGAELLVKTISGLFDHSIEPRAQKENLELKNAPKINKEDCSIDWTKTAQEVLNLIRGMSPYPAAFTELCFGDRKKERVKIFKAELSSIDATSKNDQVLIEDDRFLIPCADKYLSILEIQRAGKKRMNISQFLSGIKNEGPCTIAA